MPLVSDPPSFSDGMDRTGTYICIASEVEHIHLEGSLDVFQSVKLARCQQPYLVSTDIYSSVCLSVFKSAYLPKIVSHVNSVSYCTCVHTKLMGLGSSMSS